MMSTDSIAYNNKLNEVHPIEKMFFTITTLCTVLLVKNILMEVFILIYLSLFILLKAQVAFKTYYRYFIVAIPFILLSALSLIISISPTKEYLYCSFAVFNYYIGIDDRHLSLAILVLVRSLAALSCFYFLMFTTPITHILWALDKLKIPPTLNELMLFIYKYIFIYWSIASHILITQKSRLGYRNYKRSINSFAKLLVAIFIKSFHQADGLYKALISRGYSGTLHSLQRFNNLNKYRIVFIIVINLTIIFFDIFLF